MKIFLSWSGARSRAVAEALNDWLPRIIQALKLFYSPEIEKGSDWSAVLDAALKDTGFGIICLTPDNLKSPWIHFEAGALFKTHGAMIWTFLHGINHGDVQQPLGKYQHTLAEKEDVFRLLTSINGRLAVDGGSPLNAAILRDTFEKYWPELEEKLKDAESKGDLAENPRKEKDILLEVLETVRTQQRIIGSAFRDNSFEHSWLAPSGTDSYVRITSPSLPISEELQAEIFAEISKSYPNIVLSGDTVGNTSSINIFFKESTAISAVPDIVSIIEKKSGISGWDAKVMRAKSRFPT
jgi:hypothetical protein